MRPRTRVASRTIGTAPAVRALAAGIPRSSGTRGACGWRRVVITASAALLVGGILFVLLSAPGWGRSDERFILSRVEVRGNAVLTEDEVVALSGIDVGMSVLSIRVADVERSLVGSPRIERARVTRVLPDRIVLAVEERAPAALVVVGENACLEVTDDGMVLPTASRTPFVDLPLVTGSVGELTPGSPAGSGDLRRVLELLSEVSRISPFLWNEVSEIRIAPGSGLIIYTVADGAEVRVGSGALDSDGLLLLASVLQDLKGRGGAAESIDMRFRDQVVVRERSDAAQGASAGGAS